MPGIARDTLETFRQKVSRAESGTLQQRIERIDSARYPNAQNMLQAIKLVGNNGSNDQSQAPREDILVCYKFLERILSLVYPPPNKTALVAQMAQQLIEKNPKGENLSAFRGPSDIVTPPQYLSNLKRPICCSLMSLSCFLAKRIAIYLRHMLNCNLFHRQR
jgi:hypothetical protein